MRLRALTACLLLAAAGTSACTSGSGQVPPPPPSGFGGPVTVTFEGAPPLTVEVARTPADRARGLMERTSVPEGTGMIFLFPDRSEIGFWMKNTLVPLSIAYVDGDRVVSTAEMTPCRADPCPSYDPAGAYTVAVEAPAGFFPSHRVGPGTRMTVTGTLPSPS